MTLKDKNRFTENDLEQLFRSVDWDSGNYPDRLKKAIKNSDRVVSMWDKDKLIGLMSAITDSEMTVYFPYLLVMPEYQGKGIGKKLCQNMLEYYKNYYRKILTCKEDKLGFYEKMGFQKQKDSLSVEIITE